MAKQKTQPTDIAVSEWLAAIEDPDRRADAAALVALFAARSGEAPVLWNSMVGFGQYHYRYESGTEGDTFLVGFAARASEFALYLHGASSEPALAQRDALLAQLGKHRMGKGCLYIKKLAAIDPAVLAKLVDLSLVQTRAQHAK